MMEPIKSELEEISNLCKSVKIELAELEKEITSLTHAADDVVVLLYSRRCLELLITDICERLLERDRGTEPLKGIIEKITKEKLVPSYISTAMLNVNNNSTYGAHPKDFDKRQVRSTLIDLTTVLDWYFRDFRKSEKKEPEPVSYKEQTATEKIATKQSDTPTTIGSGHSQKSKGIKPLYIVIAAVTIIVVLLVFYLVPSKKTTKDNTVIVPPKDTTMVKSIKQEPVIQTNQIKTTEPQKHETVEKSVTNATPSVPGAKPLDLPEDIESALKMLSDKSSNPASRKASAPVIMKRFTQDAQVGILKNGYWIDGKSISDYLDWVLVSGSLYQIKVIGKEKQGDKIKVMKVEHIK